MFLLIVLLLLLLPLVDARVIITDHDIAVVVGAAGGGLRGDDDVLRATIEARNLLRSTDWGTLGTINGSWPFTSIVSFSDGIHSDLDKSKSTGNVFMLISSLSERYRQFQANPHVSFTVSRAQTMEGCGDLDTESPLCAKLTLSGIIQQITSKQELQLALESILSKHPELEEWTKNKSHDFHFYKILLTRVFFINHFGGPQPITPELFLKVRL